MTALRLLAVGFALIVQGVTLTRSYILPTLEQVWDLRKSPPWYRAAALENGVEFAGYISFLRAQVPEDGRVVLPPWQWQETVAHVGFMQYFLFPRELHNCGLDEVPACTLRASGRNTFIVALPDFPPRELAEQAKRFISYQDGMGVFVPK